MLVQRYLLPACVAGLLTNLQPLAEAVALRPHKVTDDSVCDLSPNTTAFLGGSMLIPAAAAHKDQVDAYFRLAGSFVALKCSNGQLLILQGMSSLPTASDSLALVANASCSAASVARTEVAIPFMGDSEPGFELRCRISKRDELAARLTEIEHSDPMDSLKARLQSAARDPAGSPRASKTDHERQKDCAKMSLASLIQGGACKK